MQMWDTQMIANVKVLFFPSECHISQVSNQDFVGQSDFSDFDKGSQQLCTKDKGNNQQNSSYRPSVHNQRHRVPMAVAFTAIA